MQFVGKYCVLGRLEALFDTVCVVRVAVCCSVLQCVARWGALSTALPRHTAKYCNTLQHETALFQNMVLPAHFVAGQKTGAPSDRNTSPMYVGHFYVSSMNVFVAVCCCLLQCVAVYLGCCRVLLGVCRVLYCVPLLTQTYLFSPQVVAAPNACGHFFLDDY